ncbi:MAG: hypothetical protein J6K61_04880 [Clostridia bacterium]|nr:hypothetical protein [Clostridia bacterium]
MPKKLEDFIKQYLANKKIEDYEGWVSQYGQDTAKTYKQALADADSRYAEAQATHGTKAAALLSRGMTGSGYSDYLSGLAYTERQKERLTATEKKSQADADNKKNYALYTQGLTAEAEKAFAEKEARLSSAFSALLKQEVETVEGAKAFLTANGIEEELAEKIAQGSVDIIRNSSGKKKEVLEYVLGKYMPYEYAYQYAIACGLSEKLAEEVARAAQSMRNSVWDS